MIPYSGERWRRWAATADFRSYFREAAHLAAIPHIQDWPAVYEMKRRGELAEDFALIDREQFRGLYTGREIGHSFFALKYLDAITPADKFEGRS